MEYISHESVATDEVVLEVKAVCKCFGTKKVANNLQIQCRRGEIIAIIGPNGTGKSTLGRILAGLLKEDSGEVVLFGKKCKPKERLGKVWYIPQDLDSQLFGEDLLDELTTGSEMNKERETKAKEILTALELIPFIKQHPSTLSGGQKQRLALGVALMHDAPIIVLDEPTSGLDPTNSRMMKDLILLEKNKGKTIILTTHNMEDATELCDQVAFIINGQICAIDSPQNLILSHGAKQVTYTYEDNGFKTANCLLQQISDDERLHQLMQQNKILSIHSSEPTLNDIFIELTGRTLL